MTDPHLLLNVDADIYEIRITNGTINLIFGDKAVAIGAIFNLYKEKLSFEELFDPWEKIGDVNNICSLIGCRVERIYMDMSGMTIEMGDARIHVPRVNFYEHVQIWDGIENYTYPHILGFLEDNA